MREDADLQQLMLQANELLRGFTGGEPAAIAEVNAHYNAADASKFALHDAQLVVARSYGFESWPKLNAYLDGVTVERLADAIRADDPAKARAMLQARPELADTAMSYGDERRPIHYAVMNRSPEMVRLLMRHGADARQGIYPHRDATAAWTMATERGYTEIVAIIEEEEQGRGVAEVAPKAETAGDQAARDAVAFGDIEWLRARYAEGSFVNPIRWDSGGLLTVAVRHNRPEMLSLLLDFGIDPNERVLGQGDWAAYSQGYPLWECAALGSREMAEMLLRCGADPNVHVDLGGSAVYSAYSHKHWDMVELLRRHGGVVSADTAAIYRQTDLARRMLADQDRGMHRRKLFPQVSLWRRNCCVLERAAAISDRADGLGAIEWPRNDARWFGILTEPLYFWHQIPWLYAGNRELDRVTYLTCFRRILERCDANLIGSLGRTALHEVAAMREHVTEDEAVSSRERSWTPAPDRFARRHFDSPVPLHLEPCRWARSDGTTRSTSPLATAA